MTSSAGLPLLTPHEAIERLEEVLAHAWMIRTFLKHADEIQSSPEMLAVPRTLFDCIRAVEPARQRNDPATYLRRLQGKLPKLRRIATYFTEHYARFSTHTNYVMAASSLRGVVRALEETLQRVDWAAVQQLSPPATTELLTRSGEAEVTGTTASFPPSSELPARASAAGVAQTPSPDPLDTLEIPDV